MELIITEKPSVANDSARGCGRCGAHRDGYLQGKGFLGQLVCRASGRAALPEAYGAGYARWRYKNLDSPGNMAVYRFLQAPGSLQSLRP